MHPHYRRRVLFRASLAAAAQVIGASAVCTTGVAIAAGGHASGLLLAGPAIAGAVIGAAITAGWAIGPGVIAVAAWGVVAPVVAALWASCVPSLGLGVPTPELALMPAGIGYALAALSLPGLATALCLTALTRSLIVGSMTLVATSGAGVAACMLAELPVIAALAAAGSWSVMVFGAVGVWSVFALRRSLAIQNRWACPLCGYDLRGLESTMCPECGVTVERHPFRPVGRIVIQPRPTYAKAA